MQNSALSSFILLTIVATKNRKELLARCRTENKLPNGGGMLIKNPCIRSRFGELQQDEFHKKWSQYHKHKLNAYNTANNDHEILEYLATYIYRQVIEKTD